MTAEILSVGTELLLGEILNTNEAYIARRLKDLGISVYAETSVGDNPARLRAAFLTAFDRADVVVVTGGLGPTPDDLTKETVADALGLTLETDRRVADGIRAYFADTGRPMPENNAKQALVPAGAAVLDNPLGTAPGLAIEQAGKHVFLLPGVPREMERLFEMGVLPVLRRLTGRHLLCRNVLIFGMGESAVAERLADLMEGSFPTVSPYCGTGEVRLRIAAMADTAAACEAACNGAVADIRARLGEAVVGTDVPDLQTAVVRLLKTQGRRLAVAESCTGGLIAQKITAVSGASEVFDFGACTYSNDMKQKLLGVPEATLREYGAVSARTAEAMAIGVRRYAGADIGLSVTGVAGPGQSEHKPVGLVYIGLSSESGTRHKELRLFSPGYDRAVIRELSAKHALDLVRRLLLGFEL